MKKRWIFLIVVLALLPVAFVVLATAAFVFLPTIMQRMDSLSRPHGEVLIYEPVDEDDFSFNRMDQLIESINSRLNSGSQKLGQARGRNKWQIEVRLYSSKAEDVLRVKRLLNRTGSLEFRILANPRDDKELIEKAKADPSKMQFLDSDGNLQAWWVPVNQEQEKSFEAYPQITHRTRKTPQGDILEILVVKDIYDVTGTYLTRVSEGCDRSGNPCVYFTLNTAGGQLFGELTGNHKPDEQTGFKYNLGIILDGELYSAPSINDTIFDRGEITGHFTQEEVQDLVNVLNSGSLPARIRLVTKEDSSDAGDK